MKELFRKITYKVMPWLILFGLVWWANIAFRSLEFSSDGLANRQKYYVGSMNGVELSIPVQYVAFPVEYADKSIWEPNKGKDYYKSKTSKSALSNFAIYVQWPGLKPHSRENDASYFASQSTAGDHKWFMIGVASWPMNLISKSKENRWDPSQWAIDFVRKHMEYTKKQFPAGVSYKDHGYDESTGLYLVKPTGPEAVEWAVWNKSSYWSSSGEIYIECDSGRYKSPKPVGLCTQRWHLPELQASVSVTYKHPMIYRWKEIQEKTNKLINNFRVN